MVPPLDDVTFLTLSLDGSLNLYENKQLLYIDPVLCNHVLVEAGF